MTFDLLSALPVLTPKAIAWAEEQSENAWKTGRPLTEPFLSVARRVGVASPERIRILDVHRLPMPDDPLLKQASLATGLLGPGMVGLTLGHAVLVCSGYGQDVRLLSHEFRHVHQYEQAGSIAAFLPRYLQQIVTVGAYSDETRHRFQSNVGHCFQRKPCHLFRLNPGQSFHPKIGHRFRWLAADRGGGIFPISEMDEGRSVELVN